MNFRMNRYRNRRRNGKGCNTSHNDLSQNPAMQSKCYVGNQPYPLNNARIDIEVEIVALIGCDNFIHRIAEMGLGIGKKIRVVNSAGSGPMIIQSGNSRIALGHGMAEKILVR